MKRIILVTSFLIKAIFLNAQWVETQVPVGSFGPIKFAINGCVFLSKDSIVVWDMGSAYLSTDGGNKFELWNGNGFRGARSISKVAANKYIVSSGSRMEASNDNGSSWSPVYATNSGDTLFRNFGISISHFFDEKRGFAMGSIMDNCHDIWNTDDGGKTWKKLNCDSIRLPNYKNLSFVSFERVYNYNGEVWFRTSSSGDGNNLVRVRNYGLLFDTIKIRADKFPQSIEFDDSNNGMALLRDTGSSTNKYLYKTANGGKTWEELTNTSLILNPNGTTSYTNKFNKPFYLIYGSNGLNYSLDRGVSWKKLDDFTHSKIYVLDEKNMISLFNEQNNNNNLRFFVSEMVSVNNLNVDEEMPLFYPNPAKNTLHINKQLASFSIADVMGKVILQSDFIRSEKIDISELQPGFYLVNLVDKNGLYFSKRLQVE